MEQEIRYKNILLMALGVVGVLVIPLVLTILNPHAEIHGGQGGGWDWMPGDFVWAFVVLFGAGATYELVARKMNNTAYKIAVGLAVLTALALVWINAAVGIIGEPEDGSAILPNIFYLGILALGFVGACVSRFRPQGMSLILFGMAVLQMIVPIIALIVIPETMVKTPGTLGIFMLNAVFAALFLGSGLLFQRASRRSAIGR